MADPMLAALAGQGTLFGGRPIGLTPDLNLGGMLGVDGPQSMLLNMLVQPLIGKLVGPQFMPGQFSPQQNLYDQMRSKAQFQMQQESMRRGAEIDRSTYVQMFQGMSALAGTPFGVREMRAAGSMAADMSRVMPMLAPAMPELFDRLHGSRGSALLMSQQMNMGARYAVDPLTGRTGYTADSLGELTRRAYDRMYGPGADIGEMKGMGAGRAGQLFDEMSRRGLAGSALGRDDAMSRIAAQEKTTVEALRRLDSPSLDAKLRSFEADRIVDKLKNMAGVVAAMQDVFGEMGQPDAPMSAIMNGLQMLTQNGLQSMSPEQAERMVRTTANVARGAGVSMEAMMRLTASAAGRADQLGIDRRFAADAASGGVAFGQAYGALAGGLRRFGLADKETATMLATQLETNAAASPIAQQLATTVRLHEEFGGLKDEGLALYRAVKRGATEYEYGGVKKSVYLPTGGGPGSFTDVMARSGADASLVTQVYRQYGTNQQTIADNGLSSTGRALQGRIDIEPRLFETYAQTLNSNLPAGSGGDAKLVAAMNRAALDAAKAELAGPPEEMGKPATLVREMLASLSSQGIAITPEIEASVRKAAALMPGAWNERVQGGADLRAYKTGDNAKLMHSTQIVKSGQLFQQERAQEGRFQAAAAVMGRSGPGQRIADALMNAGPATSFQSLVAEFMGWQDKDKVTQVFGTLTADLHREADLYRTADGGKIRQEYLAASATGSSAVIAAVERKYGIPAEEALKMDTRSLGAAAREGAIDRFKGYAAAMNVAMEKEGFVQVRVPAKDINASVSNLQKGNKYALGDASRLAERLLLDDKAMSVLGPGGLDRVTSMQNLAGDMATKAARYAGGDQAKFLAGDFEIKAAAVKPEDQAEVAALRNRLKAGDRSAYARLQEIADAKYGGDIYGLIGDKDLVKSAIAADRRALEVYQTDIGMSIGRGTKGADLSPEEKKRIEDTRKLLTASDADAVDALLSMSGSTGDLGSYDGGKTGRQLLGEAAAGDRIQASLPAIQRLQAMGLERAGLAGKNATPAQTKAAMKALLDAADGDLTEAQRVERAKLMSSLSGGKGGGAGLAGVLRKLVSGDPVDARELSEAVKQMPELQKGGAADGSAGKPVTVALAPGSTFTGTLDITTGATTLNTIGDAGTGVC